MSIDRRIFEQIIQAMGEPMVMLRVDHPDWPIEICNRAFESICNDNVHGQPFADVIENLVGRELALEISESLRAPQETSLPIELAGQEFLLALKPLGSDNPTEARYCAAFWRAGAGASAVAGADMHQELLKARRRIRDLSRDDPVTGLLNGKAFQEVLAHDWAVAAREKSTLALVLFTLDDFDKYVDVFGRHAADSCLRRVGQAIRRCLRRASDVVGRLEDAKLAVISHAADEEGVREFAGRIAAAVRELGLHHPRSTVSKFITVSFDVTVASAASDRRTAASLLDDILVGKEH
jgi:diguanylate cyclase (GGDEF)-like protein